MVSLTFHDDVYDEVKAAYDWYNMQSSGLGDEYIQELNKAFVLIRNNPLMFPSYGNGFKRYLLKRVSFWDYLHAPKIRYLWLR